MPDLAPLWSLCSINDEVLTDKTDPTLQFEYVDISNVTQGNINDDLETHTFAAAPARARRIARPDDIIVSTVRTYLRAIARVGLTTSLRIYSTGFAVLRPVPSKADPRYMAYVLASDQVMDEIVATSVGVSYPAIQGSALHRLRVPYCELDDQRRMADYLDRETAEIDAMIAKLGEMNEHLRDRRSTVGSSLHTMEFDEVRLQWLMREVDERAGALAADLPLLSVSIHHGVQLRDESSTRQHASADLSKYKVARAGDIVLNRMRAFQGGLGRTVCDGLVSPDYAVLRLNAQLSSEWAEYAMRSPQFIGAMSQRLRGIGSADQANVRTPRINTWDLLNLTIPLPSPDEQARITSELDGVTRRIDSMLAKVDELKTLLQERRAALITDVVTGRKEVA